MLGNQGLMYVSIAADRPGAVDMKTCRLIPSHNVNVMLLMNCFDEVRLCILQKRTKRISGKSHWTCVS